MREQGRRQPFQASSECEGTRLLLERVLDHVRKSSFRLLFGTNYRGQKKSGYWMIDVRISVHVVLLLHMQERMTRFIQVTYWNWSHRNEVWSCRISDDL